MLFGAVIHRSLFSPIAGLLVAIMVLQTASIIWPDYISPLIPVAEAAVANIDPNGDIGTNTGTRIGACVATSYFDCIDDGVTPNVSDYVQMSVGNQTESDMTTLSAVDTVSDISVVTHHDETRNNMVLSVSLVNSAGTVIGGPTALPNRNSPTTDTVSFTGLSLTQGDLDGIRIRLDCARTGGPSRQCNAYAMYATVTYTEVPDLTVGTLGTQVDIGIGDTDQYVGGALTIVGANVTTGVTSITIAEQGTVDAANDLSNIKLFYDLDTTLPYDCASESYGGAEPQYGSTLVGGFTAANGTATFTGSVNASPTQAICLYTVVDVAVSATDSETLEIQMTDPTADVVGAGSPLITPATAVVVAGTSVLRLAALTQENFHWRNDDGSETGATSATLNLENESYNSFPRTTTKRLRMAVFNDGSIAATGAQFRLEYAVATGVCSDGSLTWTDVGAVGGDFDMSASANLTEGANTTDISVASGGVTNPDTTFIASNGGVRDTSSQTGSLTVGTTEFVELEYAIEAAGGLPSGNSYCFRVTNAGSPILYTNYPELTIAADVFVDTVGVQTAQVTIPTTAQYAGGAFRVTNSGAGTTTMTSFKITANGTVDELNNLANATLRYDNDFTAPYTCDDTSYSAADAQFGATGSFNASGEVTFTGSAGVSSQGTLCMYVEYDVLSGASDGETLEITVANPSTDITIGALSIAPSSPTDIGGTTIFASKNLVQSNFHWRNNDGTESGATSASGGSENAARPSLRKNSVARLRLAIENTGLAPVPSSSYRLEWAQKISTCDAVTNAQWERVDTAADEFSMAPTGNLTDGANTTNVLVADGGVSAVATTFLSSNGGVKDAADTTAALSLPADNYFALEFAIQAETPATQGATYCFRATSTAATFDSYTNYPEVTIALDDDFKIQRGVATLTGGTLTLTAGIDYEAPAAASRAFMRITNTQLTGAGPNTGNSNNNANDVTAYIQNPGNITTSITLGRPALATGNTRVAWEIIEYTGPDGGENEIIVRSQAVLSYLAANTTVTSGVLGGVVDNADVAVFITGQTNENGGRNSFFTGLSTAAWNGGTSQITLTRGGSGDVSDVSYALVEFTGTNWRVQRVENTYSTANSAAPETQSISAVNSLTRTFVHAQKRTSQSNHADFGHEVWLSGIGQVSFTLDDAAGTPANHTSVAWVIENTQSVGKQMQVYRSQSSIAPAGAGPESNLFNIGVTLNDLSIASIFVTNRSNEAQRSWPEPILAATLISTTQYELWRSDTTATLNFRTEVVEWPTAARKLDQNYFRIYEDDPTSVTPSTAWPASVGTLGENAEMTAEDNPMVNGSTTRIRMSLTVKAAAMPAGLDAFKLQFGKRETASCDAISVWTDLGAPGSGALWRGVDNTPADGTVLSGDPPTGGDLLLSLSTVAGTYEESNNTALNPYLAFPGDEIEYDWVVQHNGADDKSSYCFRMVEADGSVFDLYNNYPILRTVGYDPRISDWRWFDDEVNASPSTALAPENVAPTGVENQNVIKLRTIVKESSGAEGFDVKFAIEYSQFSDFSQGVATATPISDCLATSTWCYADGANVDNAVLAATTLGGADACPAGCGTANESTSTVAATFDQPALAATEFEFTLKHAGARANGVYYFRLYDVVNNEPLQLASGASYPSLVTEGAQLVFTVDGVDAETTIAGITTDATSTATAIDFGRITFGTSAEVAQRITVDTNATEGYQLLKYAGQQMLNTYGDQIPPITSSNATPAGWGAACSGAATGCFGYHTTDATLGGGSSRFAPADSYAALSTTPEQVMFSSIPIVDTHDIVYRMQVTEMQVAGDYETNIVYLVIPTF